MSNETSKISELGVTSVIPENSLIPIVTGTTLTNSVDLNTLRGAILFESAYSTIEAATEATSKGDTFFVYESASKMYILGYMNQGSGSYSILLDDTGSQVRYTAPRVINSDISYVTPEMMIVNGKRYSHGVTEDAVPFIQAAIDYGKINKLPVWLSGTYYCLTAPQSVKLPGDDGTVYPTWITNGTDSNITAETSVYLPAHLRIYDGTVIIGSGRFTTNLVSTFSRSIDKVSLTQPAMFYIEGNSGINGTVSYQLRNLKISNAFIGRIVRGIAYKSFEDDIEFSSVGMAGVKQGEEQCNHGHITITGYAGDITGGHWLQRNNATSRAYLPPYPATDVWTLGWCDSSNYEYLCYTGYPYTGTDVAVHDAINTFFNTYFFKQENSATTTSGGRLSNSKSNSYSIQSFKGVTGRARYISSRYSRQNSLNVIKVLKTLFTIRAPVYMDNCTGTCKVINAMIESVGLIASGVGAVSGNYYGIDIVDPWGASTSIWGVEGGGGLESPTVIFLRPGKPTATAKVTTGIGQISESWALDTTDYRMGAFREWNPSSQVQTYIYDFYRTYAKMRPTIYYDGGPQFSYTTGTSTPVVQIAATTVTPTVAKTTYYTFGKLLRCAIYVSFDSLTVAANSEINITTPNYNGGWDTVGQGIGRAYFSHITDGTVISPVCQSGSNTIRFRLGSGATVYSLPAGTYTNLVIIVNLEYLQA